MNVFRRIARIRAKYEDLKFLSSVLPVDQRAFFEGLNLNDDVSDLEVNDSDLAADSASDEY